MTMTSNGDANDAAKKIADFLEVLRTTGGLNLKPHILACNGQVQPNTSSSTGGDSPVSSQSGTDTDPEISVEFTGPDTSLLLARNGELLLAVEHVAAKILRLEPDQHDRIFFDAEGFKATRNRELALMAEMAIKKVRASGLPHSFSPMTSRERRILHMSLAKSGLPTASSGEGPGRFVVLYPEGFKPVAPSTPSAAERTRAIRNSFRRR
jgi:spoIIIJ-associated protein